MIGKLKFDLRLAQRGSLNERNHYKFSINPYVPFTKRSKLFRGKMSKKIPWSKLVDDLEPYSLYPREEIIRLLKLYSFFVIHHVRNGEIVDIPYLGQFVGDTETFEKPWYSKHPALQDEPNKEHHTVLFRPAPFLHWYLNPRMYTPYKYQHVPQYFRAFEKFQKELYATTNLDWYDIFPDMKYLEFSLDKLRHNGTIKQYAGVAWVSGRKDPSIKPKTHAFASRRSNSVKTPKLVKDPYNQVPPIDFVKD